VLDAKITVGIPTFNGSEYISGAIESVLSSITEELRGRVQVLVSDNCSSDATPAIVARLVSLHPDIVSYKRNDKNIGFDGNVQSIFEAANGDYVHILGDDDVLAPGALQRLAGVLDGDGSLSVVLGRVDFVDIVGGKHTDGTTYAADRRFDSGDDFFQETKWGSAAVSSLVIRRDAWLAQDLERYLGSQWIHVGAVMRILAGGNTAYVLAERLATVRVGNPRWSANNGNQLYLGMKHLQVLSELTALGYRPETFASYLEKTPDPRDIRAFRARRARDNVKTALLMARFFGGRPRFWLVDVPVLLGPDWVLGFGHRAVRIVRAARERLRRIAPV
jgi:glycosyltransferase involved in cell wall biosynthesis